MQDDESAASFARVWETASSKHGGVGGFPFHVYSYDETQMAFCAADISRSCSIPFLNMYIHILFLGPGRGSMFGARHMSRRLVETSDCFSAQYCLPCDESVGLIVGRPIKSNQSNRR